jgi:hypothetical protein
MRKSGNQGRKSSGLRLSNSRRKLGNQRSKNNGLRLSNPNTISLKENMKKGMKKNMIEGDLVILRGRLRTQPKGTCSANSSTTKRE